MGLSGLHKQMSYRCLFFLNTIFKRCNWAITLTLFRMCLLLLFGQSSNNVYKIPGNHSPRILWQQTRNNSRGASKMQGFMGSWREMFTCDSLQFLTVGKLSLTKCVEVKLHIGLMLKLIVKQAKRP